MHFAFVIDANLFWLVALAPHHKNSRLVLCAKVRKHQMLPEWDINAWKFCFDNQQLAIALCRAVKVRHADLCFAKAAV